MAPITNCAFSLRLPDQPAFAVSTSSHHGIVVDPAPAVGGVVVRVDGGLVARVARRVPAASRLVGRRSAVRQVGVEVQPGPGPPRLLSQARVGVAGRAPVHLDDADLVETAREAGALVGADVEAVGARRVGAAREGPRRPRGLGHADDRPVQRGRRRPVVVGRSEVRDQPGRVREPVAVVRRRGRRRDDRILEGQPAQRAVEGSRAEAEDPAVRGDQEVAGPARAGDHPDDGLVQHEAARAAMELRVAVAEDAPVGGDQPVALTVGGGRHAHHRLVEGDAPRAAVELARRRR